MVNRIVARIDKILVPLLMLAVAGLLVVSFFNFSNFNYNNFTEELETIGDWGIKIDGEEFSYTKLPQTIPVKDKAELHLVLNYNVIVDSKEPVLLMESYYNNITASIDGTIIYTYPESTKGMFGNDTPHSVHLIPLSEKDYGKILTIEIMPSGNYQKVKIYEGYITSKSQAIQKMLEDDTIHIIIDCIFLFCGMLLIFFYFVIYHHFNNTSVLWMGIFLVIYGLWDVSFANVLQVFVENKYMIYMLSYGAFSFLIIPWIYFCYSMTKRRHALFFHLLILFCTVIGFVCFFLHITSVLDYHEIFFLLDISVGIGAASSILILIKDHYLHRDLGKYSIWGSVGFLAFLALDMTYYFVSHRARSGIILNAGFLFFSIFYLVDIASSMVDALVAKKQYKILEEAANRDALTNLLNRRSFDNEVRIYKKQIELENAVSFEQIIMLMFDSNNLKQLNDLQGHQKGDEMLVELADSLKLYFGALGNIYRIGGDEFVIICQDISMDMIEESLKKFDKEVNQNENSLVSVSFGYAKYDRDKDDSFHNVFKRAEREMYRHKKNHKEV